MSVTRTGSCSFRNAGTQQYGHLLMAAVVAVSALTHRSRCVRIKARVVRVWHAQRSGQMLFGLKFVLVDDKGGAIQGLILAADYNRVSGVFTEGRICEFGRFTVRHAAANCRTVDRSYSLLFSKDTVVVPVGDDGLMFPRYYFNFRRLEGFGGSAVAADAVIDVIGKIVGFAALV